MKCFLPTFVLFLVFALKGLAQDVQAARLCAKGCEAIYDRCIKRIISSEEEVCLKVLCHAYYGAMCGGCARCHGRDWTSMNIDISEYKPDPLDDPLDMSDRATPTPTTLQTLVLPASSLLSSLNDSELTTPCSKFTSDGTIWIPVSFLGSTTSNEVQIPETSLLKPEITSNWLPETSTSVEGTMWIPETALTKPEETTKCSSNRLPEKTTSLDLTMWIPETALRKPKQTATTDGMRIPETSLLKPEPTSNYIPEKATSSAVSVSAV